MRRVTLTLLTVLSVSASLWAKSSSFHLMKIKEVFPGCAASPNAQYIMLQMYSLGQNNTAGTEVRVFNSTGGLINSFTLPNVANGTNQATILLAAPEALTFFSLPVADDTLPTPVIPLSGGKICFHDPSLFGDIDCVSWGNYSGSSVGSGNPFSQLNGLLSGQAMRRRLDICGSNTVLDFCDDTDNSINDFLFGIPAPRNNAGNNGTIPPSTCGNGIIEGLEGCDDNNTNPGDGCDPICQVEPPPCVNLKGDYDGNTIYTSSDVVLCLNCTYLGIGNCDPCFADVTCDGILTSADVVALLNRTFLGLTAPPWCGP